jgi:hypothetical protein
MTVDSSPLALAQTGLALSTQDWNRLGFGEEGDLKPTGDVEVLTHRCTALLLARCAAVVTPLGTYADLSTSTICKTVVKAGGKWPKQLTYSFIEQLREFCRRMLKGYKEVPYHNREHAYHVVLSTNKLVDMMISGENAGKSYHKGGKPFITYGLRNDSLALLSLLTAALVHDVEHQGIPNRQLALEDDRLAVLYNDQSMAENWSLYVAFSEFLQDEFQPLRETLLPKAEDYRLFRKHIINLVLSTDIASPERTQISKSKWKEAFGDPFETVERKLRASGSRRMSMTGQQITTGGRRGSVLSQISIDLDNPTKESFEEEDDSLSATPEPSETGEGETNGEDREESMIEVLANRPEILANHPGRRHASMSMVTAGQNVAALRNKFQRRMSSATAQSNDTAKYRQRLGILRTVDLSGETLETYSRAGSCTAESVKPEDDEPDELKAAVVMETFMTAADVAHNLQGWEHMVKWSGRLYMELRRAYTANRGADPKERWFENQIGFLESYLMPVARKLEDTGVFGDELGQIFVRIVESNRDTWLTKGYDETEKVIADGNERYPPKN